MCWRFSLALDFCHALLSEIMVYFIYFMFLKLQHPPHSSISLVLSVSEQSLLFSFPPLPFPSPPPISTLDHANVIHTVAHNSVLNDDCHWKRRRKAKRGLQYGQKTYVSRMKRTNNLLLLQKNTERPRQTAVPQLIKIIFQINVHK